MLKSPHPSTTGWPTWVVSLVTALWLGWFVMGPAGAWPAAQARQAATPTARPAASARPAPPPQTASARPSWDQSSPGYVGSLICATCHSAAYQQWSHSLHSQMTRPIAKAHIEGDFSPGAHLDVPGSRYRMAKVDGQYYVSVSSNGGPFRKYHIEYTLGVKRFQGYISKLPDGRMYIMPVFWHQVTHRWIDWSQIVPLPRHHPASLKQIWNVDCVNCHAVNLAPNYDVATGTFHTTWTEMGIGCEDCHGPGAAHVTLMTHWLTDPSSRPAFDDSPKNPHLSRILRIFAPSSARPRQVLDTCGYCHGNKSLYFLGFSAGRPMADYAEPFLISQRLPPNDTQGDFWPDGRPSRFDRPQAVMDSECFRKGGATCINCHVAHGSKFDHSLKLNIDVPGHPGEHSRQSDQLCTQCHKTFQTPNPDGGPPITHSFLTDAGLTAHTHHPAASQGSRCINCHMADINWRLLTRRLDHTFLPPVPEMTSHFGEPNPCTTCHEDKTPDWAESVMNGWYHNQAARDAKLRVAEVMYRAGAGDLSVLPAITRLAVDRRQGPIIRASAAGFAGRLIWRIRAGTSGAAPPASTAAGAGQTTFAGGHAASHTTTTLTQADRAALARGIPHAVINELIGAASDPDAYVRIEAIKSLGFSGQSWVAPVLAAHLTDPIRLVRLEAAHSLLELNVVQLAGAPGVALRKAQAEYAASLLTFPNIASDHTALGWLYAETGRVTDAVTQLNIAIRLAPEASEPYIDLGVIAARQGHYRQAIRDWRRAQALGNASPNIDLLIRAAQERLTPKPPPTPNPSAGATLRPPAGTRPPD